MIEIEVKVRIEDPAAFEEKISRLGARLEKERFFEENILFDFPEGTLLARGQALRLRTIQKKTFLTFKGAPHKSRKFKVRDEFETEVKNGKGMRKILKALGFRAVFHYQKHRTVYRKKRLKICLDETHLGNFVELEGEKSDIVRFARSAGIPKSEFLKLDYVQLFKMEEGKNKKNF